MIQRTRSFRLGLALVPALALAGCAPEDDPDVDFRAGDYPGDGDLSIYEHPSANTDDDPVWQFHGPGVHSGSAEGPLIFTIDESTIRDPNDDVLCTIEGDALVQRIRDGDANGPVLYTVIERQVFAGTPGPSDDPLYRFQGPHVFEGKRGPPLVTADTHIHFASSMRKLVIVALIEAECGGPGL